MQEDDPRPPTPIKQEGPMKRITYTCLLLLVILSGCGSRGHWTKPDMTDQVFKMDLYECHKDAHMILLTDRYSSESRDYKRMFADQRV